VPFKKRDPKSALAETLRGNRNGFACNPVRKLQPGHVGGQDRFHTLVYRLTQGFLRMLNLFSGSAQVSSPSAQVKAGEQTSSPLPQSVHTKYMLEVNLRRTLACQEVYNCCGIDLPSDIGTRKIVHALLVALLGR
jgi:hypothetical protein